MIKVKVIKKDNNLEKIIIKGHAMYDDFGKDIVCAAASSTVITSINASLSINQNSLHYKEADGLIISIQKHDFVTTKIMENMLSNLYNLEMSYPKNIQIKEENNE